MNIKYIALGTLLLAGVASAQTGYYSDGKYTIERHMTDTDGDGIYDTNDGPRSDSLRGPSCFSESRNECAVER